MDCKCCVFVICGKSHLSQCEECKKKDNIFDVTIIKPKLKWYQAHIQLIRDFPWIRLGIELYCLISIGIWIMCAYLDYTKLVDFKQNSYINKIISGFLILSVIVIFCYLDAIDKLIRNK